MRNHSNYGHHVIPSVLWEGVGGAMGISLIMWSLQRSTWHSIYECCFLLSNWDLICIYIIQPSFGIALTDDFRFYMWKNRRKRLNSVFYSCCYYGMGDKVVWTSKWLADSRRPCPFEGETRVSKQKQLLESSHTCEELWQMVSLGTGSSSWLRGKFILGHRTRDFWNIVQCLAGFSLQILILRCLLVLCPIWGLFFSIYSYFSKLFLLCKYHLYITGKIQNCREVERRK